MDDDDWSLQQNNHTYNAYDQVGNDLSEEVDRGHRVRDLRLLDEISSSALARTINLSESELLAIEAGMLHLDDDTAGLIAKALGVKLTDICSQ